MNQILRCAVIDDIPEAGKKLATYIKETYSLELTGCYTSGLEAFEVFKQIPPHVVFMDIDMPEISGIELARQIKDNLLPIQIVFTTAYKEHAAEAYRLYAVDYLIKPIDKYLFNEAIQRVMTVLQQPSPGNHLPEALMVKTQKNTLQRLIIGDIYYVEADKNYINLYLQSDKIATFMPLGEMEGRLSGYRFIRVHKSYLVAEKYIDKLVDDEIVLSNGVRVPIGRSYKQSFLQFFL
jgi:DNA-binding LytR/AlgR family response regulator